MYAYLLALIVGALTGKDGKELNDRDIIQVGIGVGLASMIFTYLTIFLGLLSVDSMIGSTLSITLGASGPFIGPMIATALSIVLYLVVAFPTAWIVRMR